jgi:hypothetical protein
MWMPVTARPAAGNHPQLRLPGAITTRDTMTCLNEKRDKTNSSTTSSASAGASPGRPRLFNPVTLIQLRSRPLITLHFSILAKFILSLSKDEFCGLGPQNPLEITLRQAQADFSLDAKYKVVFGQILRERGINEARAVSQTAPDTRNAF